MTYGHEFKLRPEMGDLGGKLVNIYMYRGSWRNIFIQKLENQTEVRAELNGDLVEEKDKSSRNRRQSWNLEVGGSTETHLK